MLPLTALLAGCSPAPTPADSGAASGDPWFTLLVIPDIQYLTLDPEPLPMLQEMMDWILENHEMLNIAMVLQEGDITHNNTDAEWAEADIGFSMIEGVVPYILCVGNHDMDSGDTTRFNTWFGLQRQEQQSTFYASASPDSADDHAHRFTAGGVDWLVLSLAYDPTDEALDWGAQMVASHLDHRVIVLTHAYLLPSGNLGPEGAGIAERIVDPYDNVTFVLNGHYIAGTAAHRRRSRDSGSEVVEVFANYQDLPLSGLGRMRQMRLDPGQGTLDVVTCNAYDFCSEDDGDTFSMEDLDLLPPR